MSSRSAIHLILPTALIAGSIVVSAALRSRHRARQTPSQPRNLRQLQLLIEINPLGSRIERQHCWKLSGESKPPPSKQSSPG